MVSVVEGESDTMREGVVWASCSATTCEREHASTNASERNALRDETIFVELLDQRGARNAEAARGLALVLARGLELLGDDRALERLDAPPQRVRRAGIARGIEDGRGATFERMKEGEGELVVRRDGEEARDRVLHLAHVARPGLLSK